MNYDLNQVSHSDRGVLLKKEEEEKVAEVAEKLQSYCVSEPVKCPLIFGASDVVKDKVSFSAFGFLDGEVSLTGKLKALDDKWIQVLFEPPELKVGALEF
ncbi:probable plastid-lipid-associated protein 8, chloroplastic isoform X2 [Prunus avium]|uniref:Probable plastid-lipid-associated protein 8, chloroplastic isoform X2 n=1 Tax=Prunus avium TaxID=42229 RepID=A0A6P5TXA8_PRUAV|nr:probable plastid-lipid-associated protein 8, chloroplastic isoform X2 [Prunus avium]